MGLGNFSGIFGEVISLMCLYWIIGGRMVNGVFLKFIGIFLVFNIVRMKNGKE